MSVLLDSRRRVIRAPANPMDKSTIFSIYPKMVDEVKHTIQPGRFIIQPGNYDNPARLVVGTSSWWFEIDEERPLLEIPQSSVQVAESIVRDYCNGVLGFNGELSSPGLFWLPGDVTIDQLRKDYKTELEAANARQKTWYGILMRLADSLWARSNGNPLAISDDMRLAARELGQTTKDWMSDYKMVDMTKCVACGSLKNPDYPVCPSCKHIDRSHPKAKDLTFAQ